MNFTKEGMVEMMFILGECGRISYSERHTNRSHPNRRILNSLIKKFLELDTELNLSEGICFY